VAGVILLAQSVSALSLGSINYAIDIAANRSFNEKRSYGSWAGFGLRVLSIGSCVFSIAIESANSCIQRGWRKREDASGTLSGFLRACSRNGSTLRCGQQENLLEENASSFLSGLQIKGVKSLSVLARADNLKIPDTVWSSSG
jgi:hypothetical protein